MWTGYPHSSYSAFTSPKIWNGHNTLMQSRQRLHRGCISWNVPERLPAICFVFIAQSSVQWLNVRVQSGIPAWPCLSLTSWSHCRSERWTLYFQAITIKRYWLSMVSTHSAVIMRNLLSVFLFDTCRTKHVVSTICYHQSMTLLQNLETQDFLKISKQFIQSDF